MSASAPVATYRLQFRNGMTFDRAAALVPYLKKLGISHLYASPVFAATRGSTHGYDVIDHNVFDPDLGGDEGFERLHAALDAAGLKLILDIVPNHMAASLENPWWRSVIEFGSDSEFADHFDIDWSRRLTLPVLGKPFDEALEAGEIRLALDRAHGCLALGYFDNLFPLNPNSYGFVAGSFPQASSFAGKDGWQAPFDGRIDDELERLSQDRSFLAALHKRQSWELTYWKDARKDLSYRRFFEVTGLVGLRVEDEAVFNDVHRLILNLVRSGRVDGLRVDHVDGLARPGEYLARLRAQMEAGQILLVEKILGPGEKLPADWGNVGTTGYEFIETLSGLLGETAGREAFRSAYEAFCSKSLNLPEEIRAAKELILRRNFEGELMRLAAIASEHAAKRQLPLQREALAAALAEIIIGFEVYRTYGEDEGLSCPDLAVLGNAVGSALAREEAEPQAIKFVTSLIHGEHEDRVFRARFQQLTGPVMAKAIEDTLFYRVNPFIALNEVGADPLGSEGGVDAFHAAMMEERPLGLLATGTHDTKRGEDARARLYALAEAPDIFSEAVSRWSRMNSSLRGDLGGHSLPEPDVEWLIYQALVGVWPSDEDLSGSVLSTLSERFFPYLEKALREAKLRTDWLEENPEYEAAVKSFATRLLSMDNQAFIEDFAATIRTFIAAGHINSLSQTMAKLTAPGIPDIYQGSEVLDLSLVDPDNRRPIDFATLEAWLDETTDLPDFNGSDTDGRIKQQMIARVLNARAQHPELFLAGDYVPLSISGPLASYHAAYLRVLGGQVALIVLTRLPLTRAVLSGVSDTVIDLGEGSGVFRHVLTGKSFHAERKVPLQAVLGNLPVAMAVRIERDD
ncbi:malto-oligosyltrehalose synthase [Aquamicrobium zhengzhouense]|uniref:Malto-oligosyltrehalose synthase n=1 Tax=Aquamicrobium zhengzhouense TaxID=2781738 RepID=A0ABS0SE56_9HYPH|nr:malto-oligosyltrehalose synthase [Aquamicrobium zhengzhouense]MBI1621582.1 malto-oligosyltrehalose synthase [Aquamicrobium zhengzhouense]